MLVEKRRSGLSEVEAEIYQADDAFFPDAAARAEVQRALLGDAFDLHYARNGAYRAYCERHGVGPAEVRAEPRSIPLLASSVFKSTSLRTDSGERSILRCTSSGTQGSLSVVERDNTTLERFLGTIRNALDNVFGIEDAVVLNLGPPASEAGDVWFSYVMSVTDLVFETRSYVRGGALRIGELLEDVEAAARRCADLVLIGAPVMFLELFRLLEAERRRPRLEGNFFVITAGGWKRDEDRAIPPAQFREICRRALPGLDDRRVRDTFNMVELNTILPECAHHRKHVPVWLDVFAIDLDSYRPAPAGKQGLLAFADASPTSYPGFLMSGDLGRIAQVDDCPCGRPGLCVEVTRRVNTIEARGCALRIVKGLSEAPGGGR